jgi:hypothetical protein
MIDSKKHVMSLSIFVPSPYGAFFLEAGFKLRFAMSVFRLT